MLHVYNITYVYRPNITEMLHNKKTITLPLLITYPLYFQNDVPPDPLVHTLRIYSILCLY